MEFIEHEKANPNKSDMVLLKEKAKNSVNINKHKIREH